MYLDSRFPIRKEGAHRTDNTIERKDRVNRIWEKASRPKPNVHQTKNRFHHSFLGTSKDLADGTYSIRLFICNKFLFRTTFLVQILLAFRSG
jgi:hypothetical protein